MEKIIKRLSESVAFAIEQSEDGVLLSYNEAKLILSVLRQKYFEALRKEVDILQGNLKKGTPEEQQATKATFDKKLKEMIEIQKQIKAAK